MKTRKSSLVVAALCLGFAGACAGMDPDSGPELEEENHGGGGWDPGGETIVRWNENNIEILTTLDSGAPSGLGLIRELAIVHIAMHDAVNGARRKYRQYAFTSTDHRADPALSAAAAARAVLVALRPGKAAQTDALFDVDLARVSDANKRQRSIALGDGAASAILALRADDGFGAVVPYTFPPPAPGEWQPVPPGSNAVGAQLPDVPPLALQSTAQFRPPPPPSLSSWRWRQDYDETKAVGRIDSTVRTADQTATALFWREQTQFGWNRIARIAATERDRGLWQAARAFALVNMGLMDGLLQNFETKYHYTFWRPYTAIREIDDGRSDTVMDPTWLPLNSTPGHPEYTSATGLLGAASAYPLTLIYGFDFDFEITTSTADPPGATRSYGNFTEAVVESALSRVWAGIHFRNSSLTSTITGALIGKYIYDHELRPL